MLELFLALTASPPPVAAAVPDTVVVVAGAELALTPVAPGAFARPVGSGAVQAVQITQSFWIGTTEVTWEVWEAVMGWDDGRGQPTHPARLMSWLEIQEFLGRLNASQDGWRFRLPTQAEWEYAARAGRAGDGTDGADVEAEAWVRANSGGAIQPVATRRPNPWGIHDMQGNVWEWVADWMAPYPEEGTLVDPRGPAQGAERVRRGGSAVYGAEAAAFSNRYQQPPGRGNGNLGFRLVALPAG